jgi:hypothetical protein
MRTRTVVLAGRKAPMLLSLKRLLEPSFEVAAMTDNVLSLRDALDQIAPDLLVLDCDSAEFGAPDLAHRLRLRHPSLPILRVGNDPSYESGEPRTGFVSKTSADQELVPAAGLLLAQPARDAVQGAGQ